ncbi:hypothetical protein K7J14_07620 [Treponema zuelzerae]|uniref:Lipoprotein n=1 Tax=Teretinema zuelzerae TaxID=156 RepID=A0AAE3EIU6_9SPIR|nr:hypothetical protein [Teretinema zuelzerae]MBN2812010.1 hypothetical protein [Spirochaetales bacterium]MCD1654573.1 hypothetical protein [Teretinema zuelzerae]HPO03007.1 hypothetical protein [Treponemataceae bacterium]
MKRLCYFLLIATLSITSSCATKDNSVVVPDHTAPDPVSIDSGSESVPQPILPQAETSNEEVVFEFDTVKITKEEYINAKSEIELVVEKLNKITLSRDYQGWLGYLSTEYRTYFSSPAVLKEVSESLPTKGVKLKNLKDYFTYVFVPSRQNMRVDDIQYVSPTRVYVIMEISPKSPAAIYILEKTGQNWQLVLKNQ